MPLASSVLCVRGVPASGTALTDEEEEEDEPELDPDEEDDEDEEDLLSLSWPEESLPEELVRFLSSVPSSSKEAGLATMTASESLSDGPFSLASLLNGMICPWCPCSAATSP